MSVVGLTDTIAVIRTGGGKTAIALTSHKMIHLRNQGQHAAVSIFICPPKVLVEQIIQVAQSWGIPAVTFNVNNIAAFNDISKGGRPLLVLTPQTTLWFVEKLNMLTGAQKVEVLFVFCDEAHTAGSGSGSWTSFYPSLQDIGVRLRSLLRRSQASSPVFLAATGSLRRSRAPGLARAFGMTKYHHVQDSLFRKNIAFSFEYKEGKGPKHIQQLLQVIDDFAGAGEVIIYCITPATVEKLASQLAHVKPAFGTYHGGQQQDSRDKFAIEWMQGQHKRTIATHGFGMGLDRSSVTLIVEWNLPLSLEAAMQKAGRAGRAGGTARHHQFIDLNSMVRAYKVLSNKPSQESNDAFQGVLQWIRESGCRAQKIHAQLEENIDPCGICDDCQLQGGDPQVDVTDHVKMVLVTLRDTPGATMTTLVPGVRAAYQSMQSGQRVPTINFVKSMLQRLVFEHPNVIRVQHVPSPNSKSPGWMAFFTGTDADAVTAGTHTVALRNFEVSGMHRKPDRRSQKPARTPLAQLATNIPLGAGQIDASASTYRLPMHIYMSNTKFVVRLKRFKKTVTIGRFGTLVEAERALAD